MSESRDAPASTDLIIRQKCEAMILYGHVAVTHFPRNERHVLGAQIRNCLWSLLRLIVVCNKRYHKKTTLQEIQIAAMLWDRLRLRLNSRTQVFPVSASRGRPLDFLGYRIYVTHRRIRRSSVDRIKASLRRLGQAYAAGSINIDRVSRSVTSWIAHAGRAQSHGLRAAVLDQFRFMRGQSCQPT